MKKLWKTLFVALLVVPLLTGVFGAKTVSAAEEKPTEVNVTINKRIWKVDKVDKDGYLVNKDGKFVDEDGNVVEKEEDKVKAPAPTQNTGLEMPNFGGKPLKGAGFTVYDVTDAYYNLLIGENSPYKNSQELVINEIATYPSKYITGTNEVKDEKDEKAEKTTNEDGKATFKLPLKDGDDRDKVYMFVETSTPDTVSVTTKAAPIVLAMPIYKPEKDKDGKDVLNENIHLYPKNETKTDKKEVHADSLKKFPELELKLTDENGKEVTKVYHNLEIGEKIKYQLTLNIPEDIADVSYSVTDTPTSGLAYVGPLDAGDLVGPEIEAKDEDDFVFGDKDDYVLIRNSDGGFTVKLNNESENVKNLAGSQLIATYEMELTAEVEVDKLENNSAQVKIGNTYQDELIASSVGTGGYQFVKKDSQSDAPLSGAEFIVKQGDSNIATFEKGKNDKGEDIYLFKGWTTDKEDATTRIVSGSNGEFKVIGLKNGTYQLEETKAPDNYALLDGDIDFIVQHGQYGEKELIKTVPNTPKGLLPSTGGNGIYAFLLIGAVLMIGAYAWFKKSKTQAEV